MHFFPLFWALLIQKATKILSAPKKNILKTRADTRDRKLTRGSSSQVIF